MNEIIMLNYFPNLMVQRPHQLLRQFAKSGYQAVLYNMNGKSRKVFEEQKNYHIYDGVFPSFPKNGKRILWISYPPLYKSIGKYKEDLVVYDCIDYPGDRFAQWQRGSVFLREKADVIFVTSRALYDYNKAYQKKTFLCSNGVDFDFFTGAGGKSFIQPKDMQNIKKPVVGYIGAVADWIDWNLIRYLAASDKFSLVFIGPLFGLNEIPVVRKNVHFLGRKEYHALADYLSCFDVCIIPFRKNRLTDACNPVKMYEYLSQGKPVVATDIAECNIEVIKSSKTHQEFFKNVISSLNPQNEEEMRRRIKFARENSWENRVNDIITIIEPLLTEPEISQEFIENHN